MAANWKMYKTAAQTSDFFREFLPAFASQQSSCETIIFPTDLSIPAAVSATERSAVDIGGQNIYWEREGAFTGEVSGEMLKSAGAAYVLVGHSERRLHFCETDAHVLKKTVAALASGLRPIVCMGEKLEEHESGRTADVLIGQFAAGVAGLTEEQFTRIALAYEPLWAIGTGRTATPEIASNAHTLIRSEAEKRYGRPAADALPIIYGGSVKPDNIQGLMAEPSIDGVLVGGASLDPRSFARIVAAA